MYGKSAGALAIMRYAKKLRTVCTGLLSPTTKGLPLVPVLFLAAGCNLTQAPPPGVSSTAGGILYASANGN